MKAALAVIAVGVALQSGAAAAEDLRFVACPIYRDTDAGRKSGCWLADDPATGRRYDVSRGPTKPDWNHAILVEGQVASGTVDPCGGVVLDPVRTSILPDECPRRMLPAEGFRGNKFALPARNVAPMNVARAVPPPPYGDRAFHLVYDFDKAFTVYQLDDYLLDEAITWIRAAKPARIVVTGWATTEPAVVSGRTLAERPEVARERAETIAESLVRLGVARGAIEVRTRTDPKPSADATGADGLAEASRRRADIETFQK